MRGCNAVVLMVVLMAGCEGTIGIRDGEDTDVVVGPGDTDGDTDLDTEPDTDTDTDTDTNPLPTRPVADAGPDVVVTVGEVAELDGTGSYDPDGDRLNYSWTVLTAPAASEARLADDLQPVATLKTDLAGTWTVRLRVDDGAEISEPDVVTVTAEPPEFDPDSYDPDKVWVLGTVSEGACYRDIVGDPLSPDVGGVGFDCYSNQYSIHPDGRLLYEYRSERRPRSFTCDGACTMKKGDSYPSGALQANDPRLPHPCDPDFDPATAWRVTPAGVIHQCTSHVGTGTWVYDDGTEAFELPERISLIHVGVGRVLTSGTWPAEYGVFNPATGKLADVTGLPVERRTRITTRSRPDGSFWVVLSGPRTGGAEAQLWRIAPDGKASKVGDYPDAPAGAYPGVGRAVLSGTGELWHQARGTGATFEDVIVRRVAGGSSTLVYTEATNPLVKLHISYLVTGP